MTNKIRELELLKTKVKQCNDCEALVASRTQQVFGWGNPNATLVFIGEAPGKDEDIQGKPFVGEKENQAGRLLNEIITEWMKLRREDVHICNTVCCKPPKVPRKRKEKIHWVIRKPWVGEANECRKFLNRTLEIIEPKFICCLGAVAAQNLLETKENLEALRGKVWDYGKFKVVCTYHPTSRVANREEKMREDIEFLMQKMGMK